MLAAGDDASNPVQTVYLIFITFLYIYPSFSVHIYWLYHFNSLNIRPCLLATELMGNGVLQRFPLPHKYVGHTTLEMS
jgi:high-affinity Fe2+/Pb2+ permease